MIINQSLIDGRGVRPLRRPAKKQILRFFRRNDRLDRENVKFLRLGSVFRQTILEKAVIRRGLQDGYLSSNPHVEGGLFPFSVLFLTPYLEMAYNQHDLLNCESGFVVEGGLYRHV